MIHLRSRSLAAPPLALAILASPSLAQSVPPAVPNHIGDMGVSPTLVGDWTHLDVGDANGDEMLDAFVQIGGTVLFYFMPSLFHVSIDTGVGPVTDLTTIERGARDDLLISDSNGVAVAVFDAPTSTFGSPVTLATTGWEDAYELGTADLDGDGDDDVYAVASDERTILRLEQGATSWTTLPTFQAPADVIRLLALRWNGGSVDLGMLTDAGLYVYDQSGLQLFSQPLFHPEGFLATIPAEPGESSDRLVAASTMPNGTDWFLLVQGEDGRDALSMLEFPHPSTGTPTMIEPSGIATGRFDNDLHYDVILQNKSWQEAFVIHNTYPTDPRFDVANAVTYQLESPASSSAALNMAPIVAADLDGDSYDDGVIANQDASSLQILLGLADGAPGIPVESGSSLIEKLAYDNGSEYMGVADPEHELYLRFHPLDGTLAEFTHLETVIWRADNPSVATVPLAESHRLYWITDTDGDGMIELQLDLELATPETEYDPSARYHHWLAFRFADLDASGNIDDRSAWYVLGQTNVLTGGTTTQDADAAAAWMMGMQSAMLPPIYFSSHLDPGDGWTTTVLGAGVPHLSMRYTPFNDTPDPGPIEPAIPWTW